MDVYKTRAKARQWTVSIALVVLTPSLWVGARLWAQEQPYQSAAGQPPAGPTLGLPQAILPPEAPVEIITVQGQDQQKQPPALPPTKVEGSPTPPAKDQPTPPTPPQPPNPQQQPSQPFNSNGVFGSQPVQGYRAGDATTGTKVDVPLISYPGSISVVPQDVIRDQQALSIEDLLRDFGATSGTYDPRRDSLNVRGFEIEDRDIRWNGFLDPFTPFRDLGNIDRIELLKGPASFLYGAGQPSGVLNYITKFPLQNPFTEVTVTGGGYGLIRTTVDTTGPVDAEGNLLFRINAAYQHADSFRDFGFDERTLFAPAFTWIIDECTFLNVQAQYTNDRRTFDTGLVAIDGQIIDVPRSRFLNQPDDSERENDYKFSAMLTHQFNECWTGRIGGYVTWLDAPEQATVPFSLPGVTAADFGFSDTTILRQEQDLETRHEQYYELLAELNGKFWSFNMLNNVLLGTELSYLNSHEVGATSDPLQPIGGFPFPSAPLDYDNPNYSIPPAPLVGSFVSQLTQQRYGFYLQDLIDLNQHWKLLAGVREDILVQNFGNGLGSVVGGSTEGSFPFVEAQTDYYRTTPRVGLMYQPIPEILSFYGTYAMSFDPPVSGVFINPGDIKPETGQIVEGGMKVELIEKRLSFTTAGFYITKRNVAEQDPNNLLLLTQVGEERSQGAEMGLIGKLTDRWSVLANYAYVDARTLSDADPTIVGQRLPNAPYNNFSVWTRFNFIDDGCQVAGIGLGALYLGNRAGDLQDSFTMPGFWRYDAGLYYSRGHFSANVYFENVFDVHYYASAQNDLAVYPGSPFTMRGTVGVKF